MLVHFLKIKTDDEKLWFVLMGIAAREDIHQKNSARNKEKVRQA